LDRPDICLGTDSFHTPNRLIELAVVAFQDLGLTVAIDRPFAGALVPMKHFQKDARVHALMVELNRRLYLDETTGARTSSFNSLQSTVLDALKVIEAACQTRL
jgi:N-formylglutamate amidohydrolase